MGDLPLRTPTDRRLGGPLPRQQPNRTHPHPLAMNLWYSSDVLEIQHRVLIRLSPGYPLLRARLDTRYSPVRRSPAKKASFLPAAPRLACVKPVASVHPEPGSNSSLYNFYVCDRKIIRAFGVARKCSSKLGISLAPRSLVNLSIDVYLSQNDYPVFSRIKRFVSSTQCQRHHIMHCALTLLLVLLLSM